MEICYYWTESLGCITENKGYNFGSELHFSYDFKKKRLKVKENKSYINNFFNLYSDETIKNVTAVVGRNGVGKSTFLEEIKSLYVQGAILAYKDNEGKVKNDKKILVIKSETGYEIIYHKELLIDFDKYRSDIKFQNESNYTNHSGPKSTNKNDNEKNENNTPDSIQENIVYIGDNIKEKYNIVPNGYADIRSLFTEKARVFKVNALPQLKDASCIYFSYAFDTNYYGQRTSIDSNYFDISTKGLLNEIDYELDRANTVIDVDPTKPNHLSAKNNQFNIGFLREYYVRENKKRIELLNSEIGKSFREEHKFFPTKAVLNLDYILRRQDSDGSLINTKIKNFLRSEKKGKTFNPIENKIFNYIEEMYKPEVNKDVLALARQTYLRRILDSYFEDVNYFINYDIGREFLKNKLSESEELKSLNEFFADKITKVDVLQDIYKMINYFNSRAIKFLKDFSDTHKDAVGVFNEEEFKEMTDSYQTFITNFSNIFLTKNSAVNIKEGLTYLVTSFNEDFEIDGTIAKKVGLIEVDLHLGGLSLLKEFLSEYTSIKTGSDFIKIDWAGLSTGEDALLGMYSRFYALGKEFVEINAANASRRKKDPNYKVKDSGINLSILLDEVEHSLHPEWQRKILSNLIEFLPLAFTTAKTIQVVIATNVPFIIADIPTSNIIYLEKTDGQTQIVDKPEQTFAANIHSLLMSNFFMDTTIGKFSEQKIKAVVHHLNPDNFKNENITSLKENKQYSQEEIKNTIKTIGEPVIRTKLKSMYDEKYRKDNRDSVVKQIMAEIESDTNIPESIKGRIKDKFRELGKDQKND
ncbi:AAA family ATPase [Priestia megaterium]|uniref:hypothetical protein n=1 Tax=Priestia megaterium TaxID=1404 RepID=UPI002E1BEACE|nr:AAA family ATPase [Priestia megaterium]